MSGNHKWEESSEYNLHSINDTDDKDFYNDDSFDNTPRFDNSIGKYFIDMSKRNILNRQEEETIAREIELLKCKIADLLRSYPVLRSESSANEMPESEDNEITEGLLQEMEQGFKALIEKTGRKGASSLKKMRRIRNDYKVFVEASTRLRTLKARFVESNLRFVIFIARKYRGRDIPFLDLIQEGNIALMRAVDKFDYRLGYRFTTYASWWIRQAMRRVIQNQAFAVRTPISELELRKRIKSAVQFLTDKTGSKPGIREIAGAAHVPEEKVEQILNQQGVELSAVSLETPVGDGENRLLDFMKDDGGLSPEEASVEENMAGLIERVLALLNPREEAILRKRFGIGDGKSHTLNELGLEFGVTRERIRQIEAQALKKLRHPSLKNKVQGLADY